MLFVVYSMIEKTQIIESRLSMTKLLTGITLVSSLLMALQASPFNYEKGEDQTEKIYFTHGEFEKNSEGDYHRLTKNGNSMISEIGDPELPAFTTLFEVSPDKEYEFSYTVIRSHLEKDIRLYPYQGLSENESVFQKNHTLYQSSALWPENNLIVSDRQIMRDVQVVQVSVTPYQYRPKTQELTVFDEVEIEIREIGERVSTDYFPELRSRSYEGLYNTMIVNHDQNNRGNAYQPPTILYICGGNTENNPFFQQLVQWRHQRGYVVYTVSTSETGSSTTGIKNYIQNAYLTYDPAPEFVTLVGDVGGSYNIPAYFETWSGYGGEGDHPYSQLNGTDLFPEVLIGRMSIQNSTQLTTVVNKIIHYEKATYMDQIVEYYERAALCGDPSSSGISTVISNEYIEEVMEAYDMEDIRTNFGNGNYASWMQNQLNEGVLYFNYRGYLGMSGFGTNNIDGANNGYKLPFATIPTCGTGSFADGTAMSEYFFRAGSPTNPKGAIASVGTATWGTHTAFNNIVDMGMYDGLFSKSLRTAGATLASGKLALFNTYPNNPNNRVSIFTHWHNLMGDASTHLWTDTPTIIQATHPSSILLGTNYLEVNVTDDLGNPIEDGYVTLLMGDDEIFCSEFTDESGNVVFLLDYENTGNIDLTVTKDNYKPYISNVSIQTAEKLVNIEDNELIYVIDGNDNTPNPGESFNLFIPLKNFGGQAVTGIEATLSSSSSMVTISTPTMTYDNLNAGESSNGNGFEVTVSSSAIDHEDLDLHLMITDDSGLEWQSRVPLNVAGAYLATVGSEFVNPGETAATFSVSLKNLGSITVSGITAEIIYEGDVFVVVDGFAEWDEIGPGETITSSDLYVVDVSNNILPGSVITLQLHLQNQNGYDRYIPLQIVVGNVFTTDPTGPDNYGYYIYDSSDLGYNLAPMYDWIEINPSAGGLGTSLNLSDGGNGNYSASIAHVDLPFPFQFYGETFDEITVCTNGWIALGHSELESFRNYPIPGAGGPTNMIAAFWDDLKTSSSGNVYTYYDSNENHFIIEWYQMRTYNNNSLETFQIILYPHPVSPYGDCEIKMQYQTFNNTSAGNYGGYTPLHGAYCTIGIENSRADDGLEYTFTDRYPESAMELSDETALFITTRNSGISPLPELTYSPSEINFSIGFTDSSTSSLELMNTGAPNSTLHYSITSSYEESETPFETPGGGPDNFGHYWSDSETETTISYSWEDIEGIGTELSFPSNDAAGDPIDIGFSFPFYGETYTECIVNPNGWVGFGNDSSDWTNNPIPGLESPRPAIFGFWTDLFPETTGGLNSVFVHSNTERFVAWYNAVEHYPGTYTGTYDFQIVMYATGVIYVNYRSVSGDLAVATIGIQNSEGTDGLQVAFDETYVQNNLSLVFDCSTPENEWLIINSDTGAGLSGSLEEGEIALFTVTANSTGMEQGSHEGVISIATNSGLFAVHIPVSLFVNNQLSLDIQHQNSWNLVGVPLTTNNPSVEAVYPTSIENTLFSYNGMYVSESEFVTGKGYWLRFNEENITTIVGGINETETVQLMDDWNIISGIYSTIAVENIQDPDQLIIPNTIYEFDGSYVGAEFLEPGKGYWVRTNGPGEIIISTENAGSRRVAQYDQHLDKMNQLTFTSSAGITSTLYFGTSIPEKDKLMFSLPPKPPVGAFDIRFDGDLKIADDFGVIEMMNTDDRISVEYNILDNTVWTLKDDIGNEMELSGNGVLNVSGNIENMELKKSNSLNVPIKFALHQNYPNPFNPTTTFMFDIPKESHVNLTIYDIGGRVIKELINSTIASGSHRYIWNGTDTFGENVASGMYLYKLSSDHFTQTRKLLLIK